MGEQSTIPYAQQRNDDEAPKRKKKYRSRFLHTCGLYSMTISTFYFFAPIVLSIATPAENPIDSGLEVVELCLGVVGAVVSCTFLQVTVRRHMLAIGCSWIVWMIASFLLDVCALHQLIVEVVSGNERELLRVAFDTVLTVNAPVTIYFILLFASCGSRKRRRRARRQRQRRHKLTEAASASYPQGVVYDQLADTLWADEEIGLDDDDETIIYYV